MPALLQERPLWYSGELFCCASIKFRLCTNRLSPISPMKNDLSGEYFADDGVVIEAVKKWLSEPGSNFYWRGLEKMNTKW
jgi:hypothetical protein